MENRGIIAAFGIVIVFMSILGAYAINAVWQLYRSSENIYLHSFAVSNAMQKINIDMLSIRNNLHAIARARQDAQIEQSIARLHVYEADVERRFGIVSERFLGDGSQIQKAHRAFTDWRVLYAQLILLAKQHAPAAVLADARNRSDDDLASLNDLMMPIIKYSTHEAEFFQTDARQQAVRYLWVLSVLFLLAVLGSVAIAVSMFLSLNRVRRKNEEYLKIISANEKRYRELLDTAPDGIIIVDSDQRIQMANRQAESMFGYAAGKLVGYPIEQLVPVIYRGRHVNWVKHYLENPVARYVNQGRRLDGCRKDGSTFPAMVSLSPVTMNDEVLVTASVRDISDDMAIEKKLRNAQKMEAVGTMVGGIAHDFNNILAAIMGNIYLARHKDGGLDNRLDTIEHEARRAAEIVQNLLSFARKGILQKRELSLAPLLQDTIAHFRGSFTETVRMEVDLDCDECVIDADAEQIEQVMLNLLSNARDALVSRPAPYIRISLKKADNDTSFKNRHPESVNRSYACLTVEDNGCGIPQQDLEHIFEPFFTTKDVGKGSGLGLAMIHGAVRSHYGMVDLDSELDKGTVVRVYLPLLEKADEISSNGEEAVVLKNATGNKGRVVLVADDEAVLRRVLDKVLVKMGYEVLAVSDGVEAIEAFLSNSERIGLAILDVLMPRMGGAAAAHRIREMNPELPIIFITGNDRESFNDYKIDQLDHTAIISKPFSIDELLQVIEALRS